MTELEQALFDAIEAENPKQVEEAIQRGADVNVVNPKLKLTPLMLAAQKKSDAMVSILLRQKNLDVNIKVDTFLGDGFSVVLVAACGDRDGARKTIVDQILSDKNMNNETAQHALLYYARIGDLEKVKTCIEERHCDVNFSHGSFHTALIAATASGRIDIVKYLLSIRDTNINCKNDYNETPIVIAIREGHIDIAELFLARDDLDLHAHGNLSGTPLTAAIYYGHADIADKLISRETQFKDSEHPGAFLSSLYNKDPLFIKKMISKGADVNSMGGKETYDKSERVDLADCEHSSPFFGAGLPAFDLPIIAALQNDLTEVIPTLLEAGADLDKVGVLGRSARKMLSDGVGKNATRALVELFINIEKGSEVGTLSSQLASVSLDKTTTTTSVGANKDTIYSTGFFSQVSQTVTKDSTKITTAEAAEIALREIQQNEKLWFLIRQEPELLKEIYEKITSPSLTTKLIE